MSYTSEVLADSPVAWYRCAEASGLLQDSSGNGNHTTASSGAGSVTYQEAGPITGEGTNFAILFNAPFAFTAPDDDTLDLEDVMSVEVWVKFQDFAELESFLVTKGSGAYCLNVNLTGADATFKVTKPGSSHLVESSAIGGAGAGIWRHLVFTKTGATVKQYWDGADVTGTVTDDTMANNTSALTIGDGSYDHWVTQIAVYPTALSQARVQAHFAAATTADEEGTAFKRLTGPAQLPGSAATLYTCPTGKVARILHIHASNPSAGEVDLNLSIGADAAATRVYDDFPLAADAVEHNFDPYELAAGETIQGWASDAATVVLTITGYERPA